MHFILKTQSLVRAVLTQVHELTHDAPPDKPEYCTTRKAAGVRLAGDGERERRKERVQETDQGEVRGPLIRVSCYVYTVDVGKPPAHEIQI